MTFARPTPIRPRHAPSIENRASWVAAISTLAILSVSYGAPLIIVVGMTNIQATLATSRSVVALAAALVWIGTGTGGVVMGRIADRIGMRATAVFGAAMMACGLALSATGYTWALLVGHGLLMGFFGNGALYPPLVVYVSRWFDRRRGTAIALISSGQFVAGVLWPTPFERLFAHIGWQGTMLAYAALVLVFTVPLAIILLRPPPAFAPHASHPQQAFGSRRARVLGLSPNFVQVLLCTAGFLCCVPMSIPSAHLVAFCTSFGINPTQSAAMLSVLLGAAFVSRQFWGWLADRIGGLPTLLLGELCQALTIAAFLATENEAGLFVVAAAYGLGFSGIIPSYVLTIRELFPSIEASWRVPMLLFSSMGGMAFGSWFAGWLFDRFGFYAPAFAAGALFNLANIAIILFLFLRSRRSTMFSATAVA